jgi:NAD+ diphosphatase
MKAAEQVTFGGSHLNRAADLRGDTARLEAARTDARAKYLVLWRGKPLIDTTQNDALAVLPHDSAVLQNGGVLAAPILVGLDKDGAPYFAQDIAGWEPTGQDISLVGQFFDTSQQSHDTLPEHLKFTDLKRIMTRLTPRDAELAATAKAVIGWHMSHKFCAKCGHKTDAAQAGWQRNCPACGASHFPRTDPVVIMLITYGNQVLIGRSPGWPEGMFSLLAGFVDPGETIEGAVRREVFEEAGVQVGQVDYLASQPWPFPASLMIGCHGAALTHEINIDPKEIEDAIWVSREEMMEAMSGASTRIKPARKGSIAHFLILNWLADTLD